MAARTVAQISGSWSVMFAPIPGSTVQPGTHAFTQLEEIGFEMYILTGFAACVYMFVMTPAFVSHVSV